jgi:hypothetical protein
MHRREFETNRLWTKLQQPGVVRTMLDRHEGGRRQLSLVWNNGKHMTFIVREGYHGVYVGAFPPHGDYQTFNVDRTDSLRENFRLAYRMARQAIKQAM